MSGGMGTLTNLTLPAAFGATTVWLDDGTDLDPTYATGVSPTLWYRDPLIADIETPASETALDALENAPLDNKNVLVTKSRYGARGRMVITSVFSQGYTLADVQCQDANGTPPCNYAMQPGLATIGGFNTGYDSIDIYSYSAPLDQQKKFLTEGQVTDGFSGGVSEFDGLLEIGFPQTFVVTDTPDINPAREPPAIKVDTTWFTNIILFKRFESALLELDNAYVCPLDANYAQYKQWSVDLGGTGANCGANVVSIVSSGIAIDPSMLVGKKLSKVVGIERSVNIGSFHGFIIYPRALADFTP